MVPTYGTESLLELCTRVTLRGNTLSVRMLDYLTTAKQPPTRFREMANEFLDTCRILWVIEAGVTDASSRHRPFPTEVVHEINAKLRQTDDDFVLLAQLLVRLIDYERREGFARFQKGLRLKFITLDISKVRQSLGKDREALRMSAVMFRWSASDARVEGDENDCTSLAAALERMDAGRPSVVIPPLGARRRSSEDGWIHIPNGNESTSPGNSTQRMRGQLRSRFGRSSPRSYQGPKAPQLPPVKPMDRAVTLDFTMQSFLDSVSHKRCSAQSGELGLRDSWSRLGRFDLSRSNSVGLRLSPRKTTFHEDAISSPSLHKGGRSSDSSISSNMLSISALQAEDGGSAKDRDNLSEAATEEETLVNEIIHGLKPSKSPVEMVVHSDGAGSGTQTPASDVVGPVTPAPSLRIPFSLSVTLHPALHPTTPGSSAENDVQSQPTNLVDLAVRHNSSSSLLFLLDAGLSPNVVSPVDGSTPLTTAISSHRLDLVDILLARGADPTMSSRDGSPLHMAIRNPPVLVRLLSHVSGLQTLHGLVEMACAADQLESVKLLLRAGLSVEDRDGGVYSPLTTALREGRKDLALYLLDEGGANVNTPGEHLPLVVAMRRYRAQGGEEGSKEMVGMLLERGADVNMVYRGYSAALLAIEMGDAELLRVFVERGNVLDFEVAEEAEVGVRAVTEVLEVREERGRIEGEASREERDSIREETEKETG